MTGFYDAATGRVQYVVADPFTRKSAIIDPVLDFDPRSGSTRTTSADRLLKHIASRRFIQPVLKLIGPPNIVSDARRERISKNRDPKFSHRLVLWIVGSGDVSPLIRAPMAEPR